MNMAMIGCKPLLDWDKMPRLLPISCEKQIKALPLAYLVLCTLCSRTERIKKRRWMQCCSQDCIVFFWWFSILFGSLLFFSLFLRMLFTLFSHSFVSYPVVCTSSRQWAVDGLAVDGCIPIIGIWGCAALQSQLKDLCVGVCDRHGRLEALSHQNPATGSRVLWVLLKVSNFN